MQLLALLHHVDSIEKKTLISYILIDYRSQYKRVLNLKDLSFTNEMNEGKFNSGIRYAQLKVTDQPFDAINE